jgi:c-di-GMP-binding flagellar brake protein YcgR
MRFDSDRRKIGRLPIKTPITIKLGGEDYDTVTQNISTSGMLFHHGAPIPLHSEVELVLTLPEEITQVDALQVRCRAQVVRVDFKDGEPAAVAVRIASYEFLSQVAKC